LKERFMDSRKISAALALVLSFAGTVHAQAVGPTYKIIEKDMLDEIRATLEAKERSGELGKLKEEAITRSKNSILNPQAVDGIQRTKEARSFYYDPTLVVNKTIATPDGTVLAKNGDKFNPLDQVSMSSILVFFDGRDADQVMKAKKIVDDAKGRAKPILVGGSLELMRIWRQRIYFDQKGLLTSKFGIRQTPAVVYQEGKRLRVDELVVEGGR